MVNPDNLWIAAYSVQQGCFRVETARDMARNNLRQILGNWSNGFLPFGVYTTQEAAGNACDELASLMKNRAEPEEEALALPERAPRIAALAGDYQRGKRKRA